MSPAWCGHQTETANSRYGLTNVSNKANKILGMLSRTFTYFDVDLVKSLNSTTIEAILKVFGLTTLAKRRERGDLIQLFKIASTEYIGHRPQHFSVKLSWIMESLLEDTP